MGAHYYIGVDLGTSGCRGLAIDQAGVEQARAVAPLPPASRNETAVEQAPALWRSALEAVLDELLTRAASGAVEAVAVDGTSASLLLCDRQGEPLGAALMYNDARATAQAAAIAAVAPEQSAARSATGSLAKLLWLLEHTAKNSAAHALHQADWLAGCLAGRWGVGDENNALKLGYDPIARRWPHWLETLGVPRALLPTVVAPGTPIGWVSAAVARRFGLSATTLVVAGTTDSTASFLATGAAQPGEAVTSLGSTLVLKVVSKRPIFSPRHGVYSHRVGDLWLAGGASNSGGAVLRQFFSDRQMAELTALLDPQRSTGLDYYPLPGRGERFPVDDPSFAGRLAPRPSDDATFFQGLLEGIAAVEHRGYLLLAELGAPYPHAVRTTGGGARNAAWRRIRERCLRVPLVVADHEEAAYGAALLARRGALTVR